MTPEDRASDIVESMGNEASMPHLWAIKIKKAIIDAVEADRASRECCKAKFAETREACAEVLDAEARRLRDLAVKCREEGGLRGPTMASRVRSSAEICEQMAAQIRARSTTDAADTARPASAT